MKAAEYLVKKNLISFIGSDMHHQGHLGMTQKFATNKQLHKMIGKLDLMNKSLL